MTPVLCVDEAEPHNVGRVCVVPRESLATWLLAQPRQPLTPMSFSVAVVQAA